MTLERASELVQQLQNSAAAIDLFCHFVEHFDIRGATQLESFAAMSGFSVCTFIQPLE